MVMEFDALIFSVAYNMTGSRETAEDVVQDIQLKLLEKPLDHTIADPRNYLIRTTINHCLNLKQKERRLQYVGAWLPEPIPTGHDPLLQKFESANLLSYEMAFLMERLSPRERAVFVLREAFDFDHNAIGESIAVSAENSRQLYKRAREKVADIKHRPPAEPKAMEVAGQFVRYLSDGDLDALIALFNEDISIMGDGGGKAPAIPKPIFGKVEVGQFLLKVRRNKRLHATGQLTEILSQPALVIYNHGKCMLVQILSVRDGRISQIFTVLNPEKLSLFEPKV